ncbi:porin [Paraburkholderia sp. Ac-20340]|uniref:porin n=1 Tax=Paraburkholderia sp. Ac-20340 TaxID=2703888 RepID=UPI00197F0E05|nr:porin [Paraburkholderia sp. Ac-20340]MBN3854755.1 porin [Paraburkholderia sp. Ac-20340]
MKEALIASAVAACALGMASTPAHALSSVTLYGIADTGIEFVNRVSSASSAGSKFGMQNYGSLSASRWGLMGQEDLGGGLQAFFWLESGFQLGNGSLAGGLQFSRQSAVGLRQTDWGQLAFGRQYTSLYWGMYRFMPFVTGIAYEPGIVAGGGSYTEDNTIQYTGKFSGINVAAHYSFGTGFAYQGSQVSSIPDGGVPGNLRAQSGIGAGVFYLGNSFGIGTGYDQTNPTASATAPTGVARLAYLAASYQFERVRLMGGYRWRNSTFGNGVTQIRDDFYWAGVKVSLTPAVNLIGGYYYDRAKRAALTSTSANMNLANFSQVSLMATYSLSKTTTLYAAAAYAHNGPLDDDTLLQTGTALGYGNASTANGLADGQKSQVGATVGLQVNF